MKVPKMFVPEKGSERALEKIINFKEEDLFNTRVERLLSSCYEFLETKYGSQEVKYRVGEDFAKKIIYTLKDVENLSKRISLETPWSEFDAENLGFYFSALVNKIVTEKDTVNLILGMRLSGIGSYLAKGNVIAQGSTGSYTGIRMAGGKLTILGDAADYTGLDMTGGVIRITGKTGLVLGYEAHAGEIYVGDVQNMIARSCKANVYKKGEKVWPNDSSKSRGWLF